ncbi:MAG: DUF1127 domain-containing protein [Gemmobacter sp.]
MAYLNASRAATAGLTDRIASILKSLRDASRRRAIYRQTLRELNALSSRELDDLGIHRSMITRIATEAAYGK